MYSSTTQTTLNRRQQLYRLTNRILNTNSLHFILISLLFIPLTFSAFEAVKFYFSVPSISSPNFDVTTGFDPFNVRLINTVFASSQKLINIKILITILAITCFIILPTAAGIALITYSTNQAINHTPLTFSSTLKSLKHSYIPLLHTIISGFITLIIIFLAFTLSSIAITKAINALGSHSGDLFFLSVFTNLIISFALAFTILFFVTIWGSAAAITVLESKSGFTTLKQSANQSKEFRLHSFSIVYITGFLAGTALANSTLYQVSGAAANWIMVVKIGAICLQSSLSSLLYVVANTVLYKVASGEEAISGEYVKVVVNDTNGEVVHQVAEDHVNGGFNYLLYSLTFVWVILLCAQIVYPPIIS